MKEWKYRFKRGLASFLTVGMIAGGVNVVACIPAYAVEAVAPAAEDGEDGVRQITEGLKKQILEMFDGNSPMPKAEFKVVVNLKNRNNKFEENDALLRKINDKAPTIVEKLVKECPSELFWCDSYLGCKYDDRISNNDGTFNATYTIELEAKGEYKAKENTDATSISIQTIRDTKNAMSNSELDKVIDETIYNALKEKISKMVNGQDVQRKDARFTVTVDNCNEDIKEALEKRLAERAWEIESRLSSQCAPEMFWYDKQSKDLQGKYSYYVAPVSYSQAYNQAFCTFCFAVKKEYRLDDNADSLKVVAVQTTKKDIDDTILNNETMSDYAILCKYRDKLINDKNYKKNKGQLPQAFQWLCDQTAFTHGTACYTVTGTVGDGKEQNQHVWNIVKTEGMSYLVDLQNYNQANNWGFFLAGVQAYGTSGYKVGDTVYIPDAQTDLPDDLPALDSLRYRQKQSDFKFVPDPGQAGMVGVVGDKDIIIRVEGNKGDVTLPSPGPSIATITDLGNNQAQIHLVGPGVVHINALAGETDSYDPRRIFFQLTVKAKVADGDNKNPSGGNTGGSGSGGGTTGGGSSTGGSTGGGGSIGSLSVASVTGPELLPQVDFCIESGTDKIIKSVGAPDFTITAWGQVNDSKVTYASSDPAVATVNAETGTVHIVGAGTATISATASATTLHREEKCEYTVEVQ